MVQVFDFVVVFKKSQALVSMKKMLLFGILLATLDSQAQKNPGNGYENLDSLYSGFVHYLKAGGDELKNYCFRITPDPSTVAYMEQNNVSYRGIPEQLKKQNINVSLIGEKYYESMNRFRERLIRNNQLDNLIYLGRENQGEELFIEKLKVYVTETFILMRSGNDTIRCKPGEMFNFGNRWKSFTQPKLGW